MLEDTSKTNPYDIKKGVKKARNAQQGKKSWAISSGGKTYAWTSRLERVAIIRAGIPYTSIELISGRINRPIKSVLSLFGMPQTTYNKKKSEHALLDSRDSEHILLLTELIDYGIEVFNEDGDKFNRWLRKPNLSLGGHAPEELLDTTTGLDEVKNCLDRIEYGIFA